MNRSQATKPENSSVRTVLLLTGYIATLCTVLAIVVYARQQAISAFATPQAQEQWNDWRAAATQQADQGPVRRRTPKSEEPPSLVLLRDHFPVVITATVVFTGALYAMFAYLIRGALAPSRAGSLERASTNSRAIDE
jgi:hypothetical protein